MELLKFLSYVTDHLSSLIVFSISQEVLSLKSLDLYLLLLLEQLNVLMLLFGSLHKSFKLSLLFTESVPLGQWVKARVFGLAVEVLGTHVSKVLSEFCHFLLDFIELAMGHIVCLVKCF